MPNVILGTSGDDLLEGGNKDEHIEGMGGNDTLEGKNGDDWLFGGIGDDSLLGGNGEDMLFGGMGNDFLNGGNGDDTLYGDSEGLCSYVVAVSTIEATDIPATLEGGYDDTLQGDRGHDELFGEMGNDFLDGGRNDDLLVGGMGDDTLMGGRNEDRLFGDEMLQECEECSEGFTGNIANNTYEYEYGYNDVLNGGRNDDTLTGGRGMDIFVFEKVTNDDVVTDYDDYMDMLDVSDFNTSFDELQIEQDGSDVLITLPDFVSSIRLEHTDIEDIDAGDFIFSDVI